MAAGRFSLKAVGMGAAFVLKRLARFVGSAFLDDMAQFFVEFNAILGGFKERAREVFELLRGTTSASCWCRRRSRRRSTRPSTSTSGW